ncbi:hypothetical protein EJ08DRAFT_274908 [Tothia fuscella]|uniref:Uncharacterized protein n=1 Tax=Tothia fuscella TaxID=1048955 RepID=A0A9P4TWR3_9PEZI|nr:hypothetical protein EJ08DRAFT_274908 [Tothia fuscella]
MPDIETSLEHGNLQHESIGQSFQALLLNSPSSEHLQFLKDLQLNLPEARNISALFDHYTQIPATLTCTLQDLNNSISQLISLGSVLPTELPCIVDKIDPFILSVKEERRRCFIDSTTVSAISLYSSVFRGMIACKVVAINMSVVHLIYAKLDTLDWCQTVVASGDTKYSANSRALRAPNDELLDCITTSRRPLTSASTSTESDNAHQSPPVLPQSEPDAHPEHYRWVQRLRFELAQYIWPPKYCEDSEPGHTDKLFGWWVAEVERNERADIHGFEVAPPRLSRARLTSLLDALYASEDSIVTSATTLLVLERPWETTSKEFCVWQSKLHIWLFCLRSSLRYKDQIKHYDLANPFPNSDPYWESTYTIHNTWKKLYPILARKTTLIDIAPILTSLHAIDMARALLEVYIHGMAGVLDVRVRLDPSGFRASDLRRDLEEANLHVYSSKKEESKMQLFCNLFATLAKSNLPYRHFMDNLLAFLCQIWQSNVLALILIYDLARHNVPISPDSIQKIIEDIVHDDPVRAYKIFRASPISLSNVPELPIALAKRGAHWATLSTLLRYPDPTRLPRLLHGEPPNPQAHIRVKLVTMIADILSRHPHGPTRRIWRNVENCFDFLRAHGAEILPLMSQALTRAGIVLPLQRGEDIPINRFEWILRIVNRTEGEEVARQLDAVISRWRRKVLASRTQKRLKLMSQGLPCDKIDPVIPPDNLEMWHSHAPEIKIEYTRNMLAARKKGQLYEENQMRRARQRRANRQERMAAINRGEGLGGESDVGSEAGLMNEESPNTEVREEKTEQVMLSDLRGSTP